MDFHILADPCPRRRDPHASGLEERESIYLPKHKYNIDVEYYTLEASCQKRVKRSRVCRPLQATAL